MEFATTMQLLTNYQQAIMEVCERVCVCVFVCVCVRVCVFCLYFCKKKYIVCQSFQKLMFQLIDQIPEIEELQIEMFESSKLL